MTIQLAEPQTLELVHEVDDTNAAAMVAAPTRAVALGATPADLLRIAVQNGADLDRLERLMALQERWEANEARKAFVLAMTAFKAEPLTIYKRKQVGYETKEGDFVGYSHAELSDVTEVVAPAMAKHGLSYTWSIKQEAARILVACIVSHKQGHSESVTMDAAPDTSGKKNAIQAIASACTYMQRYTLLAATGMSTKGMDDDGHGAGDADAEHRRRTWLDDQLANIRDAQSSRDLKSIMTYAVGKTRENNDPDAEAELNAAFTAKMATAKPKTGATA
jgi:hypothetical protein